MRMVKRKNMETRTTAKGQIVIPASLRKKFGINIGTKVIVTDNGASICLVPITENYLRNLQGSLKGKGLLKTLIEERQKYR